MNSSQILLKLRSKLNSFLPPNMRDFKAKIVKQWNFANFLRILLHSFEIFQLCGALPQTVLQGRPRTCSSDPKYCRCHWILSRTPRIFLKTRRESQKYESFSKFHGKLKILVTHSDLSVRNVWLSSFIS